MAEFLTLADRMVLADAGFNFQTFTDLLFFVIDASMHKLGSGGVLIRLARAAKPVAKCVASVPMPVVGVPHVAS